MKRNPIKKEMILKTGISFSSLFPPILKISGESVVCLGRLPNEFEEWDFSAKRIKYLPSHVKNITTASLSNQMLQLHTKEWNSFDPSKYHWGNKKVEVFHLQKTVQPLMFLKDAYTSDIYDDLLVYSLKDSKELVMRSLSSNEERLRFTCKFAPHFIQFCSQQSGASHLVIGCSPGQEIAPSDHINTNSFFGALLGGLTMLTKISWLVVLDANTLKESLIFSSKETNDFNIISKPLSEFVTSSIDTVFPQLEAMMFPGTIRSLEAKGKWLVIANEVKGINLIVFDLNKKEMVWNFPLKEKGICNLKLYLGDTTLLASFATIPITQAFTTYAYGWEFTTGKQVLSYQQAQVEPLAIVGDRWFLYACDLKTKSGTFQSRDLLRETSPSFTSSDLTFTALSIDQGYVAFAKKEGVVWVRNLSTGEKIFEQEIPSVSAVTLKQNMLLTGTSQGEINLWLVDRSVLLRKIEKEQVNAKIMKLHFEKEKIVAMAKDKRVEKTLYFKF